MCVCVVLKVQFLLGSGITMTGLSLSSKSSLPPPPVIGVLAPALLPEVKRERWAIQPLGLTSGNSVCGYWVGGRSRRALCCMWVSSRQKWYMVLSLKLEFNSFTLPKW